MAAKHFKFTEVALKALQAETESYERWDLHLPGFGIRVSPKGRKAFFSMGRLPIGPAVRVNCGLFQAAPEGEVIVSLKNAREKAKRAHDLLKQGIGEKEDGHEDFVFTLDGKRPFNGWSKAKIELDTRMLKILRDKAIKNGADPEKLQKKPLKQKEKPGPNVTVALPHWQHHDLRRTAKTLMIRAGIRPDISERVLGHVIGGVEGVYDRYSYLDEKRDALDKLAILVGQIINPPADADNVLQFSVGTGAAS